MPNIETDERTIPDYAVHDEENVKGFFGPYAFLSNFHSAPVWFDGVKYDSTEAAYQAAKCGIMEDRLRFKGISPAAAKRLGQVIPMVGNWEEIKYDVMTIVVADKFYRHLDLRAKLIETGSRYLEETNHWNDRTWGVYKKVGKNWLGHVLMRVRGLWLPLI